MRQTITILALAALLVAACGSSTPSASASSPPAATAAASGGGASAQPSTGAASLAPTTLRVLVHQNPPFTDYMKTFNAKFEANHPGVKVEMSIVAPNDLATITQTRIAAKDVDVVDMFAFDTGVQSYMKGATPPIWQTLADAGSLMDLTGQPFVGLYDPAATRDAGTYNGKVYEINLGRVGFSGLYLNQKLFTANNVKVPTTWSELVTACQTFKTANVPCITAGGQDGWPIFVTGYGILGSAYPDQAALVEGLWKGTIKYNDATSLAMWEKLRILAMDMIEPGASGIAADGAPGRFASGEVAALSGFTWLAPAIESAKPDFEWTFIPFPGSDVADDNKYIFGKYDQGWTIASATTNKDASLAYLAEFSEPATIRTDPARCGGSGGRPARPVRRRRARAGTRAPGRPHRAASRRWRSERRGPAGARRCRWWRAPRRPCSHQGRPAANSTAPAKIRGRLRRAAKVTRSSRSRPVGGSGTVSITEPART